MSPHYILLIHGIGDIKSKFGRPLEKRIFKTFEAEATRILGQRPVGRPDIREVMWSDITQDDQNRLWNSLFPDLGKKSLSIWSWLKNPSTWIPRLRYWAPVREFVVNYLGDPIAYVESPGINKYKQIHERVMSVVNECAKDARGKGATQQKRALLTIVGHSLGSVMVSDLLYDVKNKGRAWPPEIRFANFITLGSPLALYVLRYGFKKPHTPNAIPPFSKPISMNDPDGLWTNIFDPQDVLGYPLKPLNDEYKHAVFADKVVNAGQWWKIWQWWKQASPLSHALYWEDKTVAEIVGRKVALDWLRENQPGLNLQQKYEDYKTWVMRNENGTQKRAAGEPAGAGERIDDSASGGG